MLYLAIIGSGKLMYKTSNSQNPLDQQDTVQVAKHRPVAIHVNCEFVPVPPYS